MTSRENSEWFRYVLWACAMGFWFLPASLLSAPVIEFGTVASSPAGIFLFGFSSFVFRTCNVEVDPLRRTVTISSKGFRKAASETMSFDSIASLAQNGRKIEAAKLASGALGLTRSEAQVFVEENTGLASPSRGTPAGGPSSA